MNTFGCDTCKHQDDGKWLDYCEKCNPDHYPPSEYRPIEGSIQEKEYFDELKYGLFRTSSWFPDD